MRPSFVGERTFTRPQNVVRSFFGMGPAQLGALDTIVPVIDVDNYAQSFQEQQIIQQSGAALAPGASQLINLALPRPGYWLIDQACIFTTGPAASGSIIVTLGVTLNRAGTQVQFGLLDGERTMTKAGVVTTMLGVRFRPALVLFQIPGAAFNDVLTASVLNAAGSVGNVVVAIAALTRQLELAQV